MVTWSSISPMLCLHGDKKYVCPDNPQYDGCAQPISSRLGRMCSELHVSCSGGSEDGVGHFLTEDIYRALSGDLPQKVIAGSGERRQR